MAADSVSGNGSTYTDFVDHCGGTRTQSEITLYEILKKRYPSHHITRYNHSSCDFQGYAKAGFAEFEIDDKDEVYFSVLSYVAPAFRLDRTHNPGELVDSVTFGKFKYTWTTTTFILYNLTVQSLRGADVFNFILAPKSEGAVKSGRSDATNALMLACGQWTSDLHKEVYVFDQSYWKKQKDLYKSIESSTWDDVILDPATKDALVDDVEGFFESRSLYSEFQVPWKRGIILHGLPGNGKTISLKALMNRLMQRPDPIPPLYVKSLDGSQRPEQNIRTIFSQARIMAPCLLIFEDLDSLITDATRSYFLNEVDGLESNEGILIIGSTNHLDKLDPAIRDRPSRFDRKYFFKLPGHEERTAYAQYWQTKLSKNKRVEFPDEACEVIANLTEGFSFAYLKELFVASLLAIARGNKGESIVHDEIKEQAPPTPDESVVVVESDNKAANQAADKINESTKTVATTSDPVTDETLAAAQLRQRAFQSVTIPESLQSSVLVRVIHQQIRVLLSEMATHAVPPRVRAAKPIAKTSQNAAAKQGASHAR